MGFYQPIEPHTSVFLIILSKIQLNEACLLYLIIFTKIDIVLKFFFNKWTKSSNLGPKSYLLVNFFCCFEIYLQKLTKNSHLCQKSVFLNKLSHIPMFFSSK